MRVAGTKAIAQAGAQIAAGLSHLHSEHVVHRDVAVRNVLVSCLLVWVDFLF